MKYFNYKKEKLGFYLDNYANNGELYIGLYNEDNECYTDLTINIPTYLLEFEEEVIISGDVSNELIKKLVDMGILIDTYKIARSGFGSYKVMIFVKENAKDYIISDYSFGAED